MLMRRGGQRHGRADFIKPLISYMTPSEPSKRPTAEEAFTRFKTIERTLTGYQLSQRLHPLGPERMPTRIIRDIIYRLRDRWWTLAPKKPLLPLV